MNENRLRTNSDRAFAQHPKSINSIGLAVSRADLQTFDEKLLFNKRVVDVGSVFGTFTYLFRKYRVTSRCFHRVRRFLANSNG